LRADALNPAAALTPRSNYQAYREVVRYWRELAEEAETSSRH
jgi:hypothetical protein